MTETTEPEAKSRRKDRTTRLGDAVHYWTAAANKDIGPAEKPCHAVVANVLEDDNGVRCTLAVLNSGGGWVSRVAVRFSEVPKTNCWTWPK